MTIMMEKALEKAFDNHVRVLTASLQVLREPVQKAAELISQALVNQGTLFWCGNGGSAADSQHLAAEMIGRFEKDRPPLRSIALTTDSSVLTCIGNDYCFEDVFSRQLEGLGRPGDVLVAISTSGRSENIRRVLIKARQLEVTTVALLGKGGGPCLELPDIALVVPSDCTARIQEMHILLGHVLCELIEWKLGFRQDHFTQEEAPILSATSSD
jgi:D-sedoheptulose 7-phosphate isomerase